MNIKRNFWLVYYVSLLVISILSAMIMKYNQTGSAFVPTTILAACTIFTISILSGHLAIHFKNRASKLSHSELNKKILPGFLIFLFFIFIITNLTISLGIFIWFIINDMELSNFFTHLFKNELSYANQNLFFWFVFFSISFFYVLWKKSSNKEQNLREENLKFKYQTLKSQINPHFLFNNLNTLSELVYEDAKKADHYIQKLSSIYRYLIENEETKLIELEKEINFVQDFFVLQKERYRDKILLNINIPNIKDYKIIPISLQSLVENAIKHNLCSLNEPLIITIFQDNDDILVSNNIQKKDIIQRSMKIGLQNLKERVRLILGKELIIKEESSSFIVKIPIIQISK